MSSFVEGKALPLGSALAVKKFKEDFNCGATEVNSKFIRFYINSDGFAVVVSDPLELEHETKIS